MIKKRLLGQRGSFRLAQIGTALTPSREDDLVSTAEDLKHSWTTEERAIFVDAAPPPPDGQFELGLVLGGTVSAGAYTAGVLDFLVEALDAWEAAKLGDPRTGVPDWRVTLKAVAGTSGGGVLAAILAKALSYDFAPVRATDGAEATTDNPFYQVWVERLDIAPMLTTQDIPRHGPLPSLLNGNCLKDAANYVANYSGRQGQRKPRNDVQQPLPVYLTLTNLSGLPCSIDYQGGLQQHYVDHAEYAKFYVFTQGGQPQGQLDDGFVVGAAQGPMGPYTHAGWNDVANFARGTGAFPIGLPACDLSLPVQHLRLRPKVVAAPASPNTPPDCHRVEVIQRPINWLMLADAHGQVPVNYEFTAVDGGVLDNEPIELCRRELAGMTGRNERSGDKVRRAVLLVDPFSDPPDLGAAKPSGLIGLGKGLLGVWKSQARYDTQDLQLALQQDCFSRFLITARRDGAELGGRSIACASLFAFGGFLSQAYRRHDFFLGRKNCRDFLLKELLIPVDNDAQFGAWKAANPGTWRQWVVQDSSKRDCLPLIPLFGACRNEEHVPPYPKGAFNPDSDSFQDALEERIEAALGAIVEEQDLGSITTWLVKRGIDLFDDDLVNKVKDAIRSGLKDWQLV